MNALFIFFASLCLAQEAPIATETYKKIEVTAEASPPAPAILSPGLNLNQDFKSSSDEVLPEIPNVNFASGTNRPRYLQIRGQGETGAYDNTPSHSVGFFIDDIDLTGISASWPVLNTAAIEVFKGPQSTEWGGNVIGGELATRLTEPGAPSRLRLDYESQNAYQAGAEVDLAKKSRLFFDYNSDPGFYKNTFLGNHGAARDEYYVSLKNEFLDTENWHISSSHTGVKTHDGYDVWSLHRPGADDAFQTLSDQPGQDSVALNGHSLHVERRLNDTDSLVSMSSVAFSKSIYSYDSDWGNNAYWESIPGWNKPYDYFDEYLRDRTAWHQKLFFQRGPSQIGIHLYGLDEQSDINHFKDRAFQSGLVSHFASASAALFGDWRIPISDADTLQMGGRYEAQSTRYSDTTLPGVERTYRFASEQVGWERRLNEGLTVNALISRGFKSPGVNIDSSLPASERFYDPEYVTNYEAGLVSQTLSSRFSSTLFYMDHRDMQVKVSRQEDPTDPSSFTYFTNNAARAVTYGAELSAQQNFGSWQTEAQLGLLKAEFRDYTFENQDLSGRELAHSPTWSYAAGVSKNWTSYFSNNLSVIGKNDFAFSNNHDQRSTPYHLVNLGATYHRNHWALSAWVKNIFDTRYETRGYYFADEPPNWQNKLYVQTGDPRHAGVTATYQF